MASIRVKNDNLSNAEPNYEIEGSLKVDNGSC